LVSLLHNTPQLCCGNKGHTCQWQSKNPQLWQ
jgi:hypothetical protein